MLSKQEKKTLIDSFLSDIVTWAEDEPSHLMLDFNTGKDMYYKKIDLNISTELIEIIKEHLLGENNEKDRR